MKYMISATVTRPAAITPTTNRTYKVKFENRIDIGSMYTPKSRAVYLEPTNRRGKAKKAKAPPQPGTQESLLSQPLSRQNTSTSTRTRSSSTPLQNPPLSPAPSEDTVATHTTNSTHSLKAMETENRQRKHSDNSEPRSSTTSASAHTISATTEIQRHGALPGDLLPVRVKVEHTKAARGVVIATLYRQGRIDMLPALPLANRSKDKKPEYEDVYPKSRTGLGGLYFTKGAPNMAFRKDLTQTSTMMIVDPQSKTADVNFKVRVPNEAFPTIDNIQGGMISFTYHVEVVIDLTGKLGESRILPSLTTNGPSFSAPAVDTNNQVTHEWADNILDTAPLRRTKNVVTFELPITVGTDDTARIQRQDGLTRGYSYTAARNNRRDAPQHDNDEIQDQEWYGDGHEGYDEHYGYYGYDTYSDGWFDEYGNPMYNDGHDYDPHYHHNHPTHHRNGYPYNESYQIPPPHGEQHTDEKSRLRRQEELLLPSAPPVEDGEPGRSSDLLPSAPFFTGNGIPIEGSSHQSVPITISRASARSADTIVPDPLTPPPSLPENEAATTMSASEDKQELERQRLAAQASAPPTDDDDSPGPSRLYASNMPTAPVIDDEAEYMAQALRQTGHEGLPQYQR